MSDWFLRVLGLLPDITTQNGLFEEAPKHFCLSSTPRLSFVPIHSDSVFLFLLVQYDLDTEC